MSNLHTTKKPELDSGLLATFYTEKHTKFTLDAAPQIYACQPHTVRLLRFCIVNNETIPEPVSVACHQLWGHRQARQNRPVDALRHICQDGTAMNESEKS